MWEVHTDILDMVHVLSMFTVIFPRLHNRIVLLKAKFLVLFVYVSDFEFCVAEIVLVVGVWDEALFEHDVVATESERFEQSFDDDGVVLEAHVSRPCLRTVWDLLQALHVVLCLAAAALAVDGS